VRRALRECSWSGLTLLGVFVGLFIGLAVAPELPGWAPWVLAAAVVVAVIASWFMRRRDGQPH
jgi:hypothetical protein